MLKFVHEYCIPFSAVTKSAKVAQGEDGKSFCCDATWIVLGKL